MVFHILEDFLYGYTIAANNTNKAGLIVTFNLPVNSNLQYTVLIHINNDINMPSMLFIIINIYLNKRYSILFYL
jgi:hypothetical protein